MLTNSAGVPWTAAYVDSIGEPTADFRSNIAAEARAKIIYERLINVTDDPGIKDALGFLMTRELAHQKSFEKALHAIQPNFPQGKLPGIPEFTNVYFNLSQGDGDVRGAWNQGDEWEYVDKPKPAVDGGSGLATRALYVPSALPFSNCWPIRFETVCCRLEEAVCLHPGTNTIHTSSSSKGGG